MRFSHNSVICSDRIKFMFTAMESCFACELIQVLVLDTRHYTNEQFKAFRNLQAYNQIVPGFISSVQGTFLQKKTTCYCCQSQTFTKNERYTCHFVDYCRQRLVHFICTLHWMHGRIRRMLFSYCQCFFM